MHRGSLYRRCALFLIAAVLAMPAWPAPSTSDTRDIVIQTWDYSPVTSLMGCEEGDMTVYNTGPEFDLADEGGNDCPTAAYDAMPIILVVEAEQMCPYTVVDLNEGVSVTMYGETNGAPGLQTQPDAAGRSADQYCSMP